MRDTAFGCDWVGTAIQFKRSLMLIIATANKVFQLTAGKFVPLSNLTMMNADKISFLHYFFTSHRPLVVLVSSVLKVIYHTQITTLDRTL